MGAFTSYHFFDETAVDIVPVIASFDTEGRVTPLYVRLQGESCRIVSFWFTSRYAETMEFRCQVDDHGYQRPLILTFYQAEGMWTIPHRRPP